MEAKLKVFVTETLTYRREAIVTLPLGDVLTDASIMALLDRAEQGSESADDVMYRLIWSGCTVVSPFDDYLESPDGAAVEIDDYEIVEVSRNLE